MRIVIVGARRDRRRGGRPALRGGGGRDARRARRARRAHRRRRAHARRARPCGHVPRPGRHDGRGRGQSTRRRWLRWRSRPRTPRRCSPSSRRSRRRRRRSPASRTVSPTSVSSRASVPERLRRRGDDAGGASRTRARRGVRGADPRVVRHRSCRGRLRRVADALAAALGAAGFDARVVPDVMRWKYTKLLMNLGNAVEAICVRDADAAELVRRARSEARTAFDAAGIAFASVEEEAARRGDLLQVREIDGAPRGGGSSWQSIARGLGSIEADAFNGEIVRIGAARRRADAGQRGDPRPGDRRRGRTHRAELDPCGGVAGPAVSSGAVGPGAVSLPRWPGTRVARGVGPSPTFVQLSWPEPPIPHESRMLWVRARRGRRCGRRRGRRRGCGACGRR